MNHSTIFEWGAQKHLPIQKKHSGVNIEIASRVFSDPNFLLRKDRMLDGEQRLHAIGCVRKAALLLLSRYLEESPTAEETIRILSASEANPHHRRICLKKATE